MGTFLLTDKLLNIDYWNDYGNEFLLHRGQNVPEKEAQILFNRVNMVRAGVVSHPSLWSFSGYNEIQEPRRKNILIDYNKLQWLIGSGSYDQLKSSHRGWVDEYLRNGAEGRQDEWTGSIAACPACPVKWFWLLFNWG
jgi:hypothetical protein